MRVAASSEKFDSAAPPSPLSPAFPVGARRGTCVCRLKFGIKFILSSLVSIASEVECRVAVEINPVSEKKQLSRNETERLLNIGSEKKKELFYRNNGKLEDTPSRTQNNMATCSSQMAIFSGNFIDIEMGSDKRPGVPYFDAHQSSHVGLSYCQLRAQFGKEKLHRPPVSFQCMVILLISLFKH